MAISDATKKVIADLWAKAVPAPEVEDPKVDPATIERAKQFKPRQMVKIIKDQPDFSRGAVAYPAVGFRGMVVTGDRYNKYTVPAGKVAVRFSAKLMGYLDYAEKPFVVVYVWAWAIA